MYLSLINLLLPPVRHPLHTHPPRRRPRLRHHPIHEIPQHRRTPIPASIQQRAPRLHRLLQPDIVVIDNIRHVDPVEEDRFRQGSRTIGVSTDTCGDGQRVFVEHVDGDVEPFETIGEGAELVGDVEVERAEEVSRGHAVGFARRQYCFGATKKC